jgi:ATP-dependent Clp protease ATP-binding subunit ClpA
MDAANMLKPALVRGDFRVIGATTDDEYGRWVLGDPALERRFQKVAVRELGSTETLDILKARKERLERHHNVLIADDALAAAVQLTDAFVTDRRRPDKAIDALDEACAHAQAIAVYSADAEALIAQRRRLAKEREAGLANRAPDSPPGDARPSGQQPDDDGDPDRRGDVDPLERFAQNSVSALERFGAELEAMFVGSPPPAGRRDQSAAPTRPSEKTAPLTARPASLSAIDAELARRLMEEGIVVRGHDVARVVGLMVGRGVTWDD